MARKFNDTKETDEKKDQIERAVSQIKRPPSPTRAGQQNYPFNTQTSRQSTSNRRQTTPFLPDYNRMPYSQYYPQPVRMNPFDPLSPRFSPSAPLQLPIPSSFARYQSDAERYYNRPQLSSSQSTPNLMQTNRQRISPTIWLPSEPKYQSLAQRYTDSTTSKPNLSLMRADIEEDSKKKQTKRFLPTVYSERNRTDLPYTQTSSGAKLWGTRLVGNSRREIGHLLDNDMSQRARQIELLERRGFIKNSNDKWVPGSSQSIAGLRPEFIPRNRYGYQSDRGFGYSGLRNRTQSEPNLVNIGLDYCYAEPLAHEENKILHKLKKSQSMERLGPFKKTHKEYQEERNWTSILKERRVYNTPDFKRSVQDKKRIDDYRNLQQELTVLPELHSRAARRVLRRKFTATIPVIQNIDTDLYAFREETDSEDETDSEEYADTQEETNSEED